METLSLLGSGFAGALETYNVLMLLLGVAVGILGGAMPGLSASTTVALLLPLTYGMPPDTSIILLAATYVGAEYGGSISAIFINTPGTPGAIVTTFDGYPLTKRGYPIKALCFSLVPGTIAGLLANVALITISIPLVEFALKFGPAEYFALGVFGLATISSLTEGSVTKAMLAAAIGLLLATIGTDTTIGFPRFTFEYPELLDGIPLVPALIGMLALSEAFMMVEELGTRALLPQRFSHEYPTWPEWKSVMPASLRGSVIGLVIGAIPGAGSTIASIISYSVEKRASRHPEKFGTGTPEGIAGPEAANNAVVGGTLIPMLTLGIPGSATAAIMISALMLHGLQPGPELFSKNPEVVYNLFASQFLANLAMLALGLIGMTWWIKIVEVPKAVLAPCIIAICFVGSYAVGGNIWDIGVVVVFGIGGYSMRKLDIPVAPTVLALVLGFMVEANFRRMLLISGGDWLGPLMRPITAVLLALALISFVVPFWRTYRRRQAIL